MATPIRCSKCFITLERLKEDKICTYLLKIVKSEGKEALICPLCHAGWS